MLRRLAALVYDSFIIISALLPVTGILFWFMGGDEPPRMVLQITLIIAMGSFVSWFWSRSGQTLGMLAWKIKLTNQKNENLSFKLAWQRFALSLIMNCGCGIGLLWALIDKDKQALYDRILNTRLIKVEPKKI